jgi:uncharacterized protein
VKFCLEIMENKKTVIIGATTNPARYAYLVAHKLQQQDIDFIPLGIKKGNVFGKEIILDKPILEEVHTITLYINPQRQVEWEDYIFQIHPKRVIFNPGTENFELAQKLENQGIEVLVACTLVMLSTQQF